MAAEIGIAAGFLEDFLIAEIVKELDEAFARKACLVQIGEPRLIGAGFLLPGIAKIGNLREITAGIDQTSRRIRRASYALPRTSSSIVSRLALRLTETGRQTLGADGQLFLSQRRHRIGWAAREGLAGFLAPC